jgi:ATP-binding protein involved in chromosome partitioning
LVSSLLLSAVDTNKDDADTEKILPIASPSSYGSLKSMSMGYLMPDSASQAAVWRGPMVMSALDTFINKVQWSPLDVLVIDMPPGTGDVQLTVTQKMALSGSIVVTTPQELALSDARRGITMFRKVGVPILGVIENMSSFICDGCGKESFIFGHGGAQKISKEMNVGVLGAIPLMVSVQESADKGVPVIVEHPNSPVAAAYNTMAALVWRQLSSQGSPDRDGPSIRMQ